MKIHVNGTTHEIDVPPQMPLLWVLRDIIGLTGTKFGCGQALCGACTVHLDGVPTRSCVTPVSAVGTQAVRTVEGLAQDGRDHPVQEARPGGINGQRKERAKRNLRPLCFGPGIARPLHQNLIPNTMGIHVVALASFPCWLVSPEVKLTLL